MRILSRCVIAQKTVDDINRILLNSSGTFTKPEIASNTFLIYVCRRNMLKGKLILCIKGSLSVVEDGTKVFMEVHAGAYLVISGLLLLAGLLGLFWCCIYSPERWFQFLCMLLIGAFCVLNFMQEGKDALEQLENKLLR